MKQYTIKELLRMGVTKQRQLLRELNKVARAKAKRLVNKGYTGEMTKPPIVSYKSVPREELVRKIEDLQIYNRSKLSTVKGMDSFVKDTLGTLRSHGYDFVTEENLSDFGRFMNEVKDLHKSKMYPSNEVAQLYKNMERLGVSTNVIKRKFRDYLSSEEGITDLTWTLRSMQLPEGRKRISSTEVREQMEELGFL